LCCDRARGSFAPQVYSCNEALLQRELDRLEERTGCVVLGPSDTEAIARCVHEPREIEVVCGPGDSASLGEWAAFAEMHLVKRYEERGLPKSVSAPERLHCGSLYCH
jgi:hypothetical protein